MSTRRAAAIDGAGKISVIEEAMPEPKPGQVLIEVTASMVSPGTELGGVKRRRESPTDAGPRPFGYSNAGVVIAQGEGCEDVVIGTRVACMGGGYAQHASHVCVPRNMAVPIPDGVKDEHAASIHLVATGLNAFRRGDFKFGEFMGVVGLGLVGQFTCQLGRLAGCHVIGLDTLPMRLDMAQTCGLERGVNVKEEDPIAIAPLFSRGYGLDGAVIAFGGDGTQAFVTLTKMIKKTPDTHLMGRIVIVGGARIEHNFAAALGNLDVRSAARTGPGYHDEAWEHGADYPGVFVQWTTRRNMEECLVFMASGGLLVEPLITHRVALNDAPDACEELIQHPDRALGVVFLP
ncbi:MAG: zinc-binding alcohol dehydrogenase [Candidatus Latescibacteria bacterium]|jgi:NADPH:quinone reductase|nr:zinc-binding alcohol dehydrogenase [Candidatus Latescibacterota bacterium]MBT4140421.1 zinc-binding alcohol dehydrogenase [Candidatus Latescibacterota bacterium]MBT5833142.1 zinc-binding alcohol dehydrogenase [Candidatus Latescibacterota bacterium]